jgi:hypothetical protein
MQKWKQTTTISFFLTENKHNTSVFSKWRKQQQQLRFFEMKTNTTITFFSKWKQTQQLRFSLNENKHNNYVFSKWKKPQLRFF